MVKFYPFKVMLLAITLITQYSFSQLAQNAPNEEKQTVSKEQQKQLLQNNQSQIGFEENKGQVTGDDAERVNFMLIDKNMSMFLLNDGLAYQFNRTHYPEGYKQLNKSAEPEEREKMLELAKEIKVETYRMDISLEGANPNAEITTEGKSEDYTQYYNHDALNVHRYNKVTYHDVYPNIDWVLYKSDDKIKYDFVVHPGGDPNQIKLKTSWVENLKLNQDGSITLKNRMGEVTERTPISFQGKNKIKTHFKILDTGIISFDIEEYNTSQILVVDPTLQWATYYGGSNGGAGTYSYSSHSSNDGSGNVYLAGYTRESNNIASGGHDMTFSGTTDCFLVKFNSAGVRQWATYYGNFGWDFDPTCATDGADNVYLSGTTEGIATTAGSHQPNHGGATYDAFIVKFNSSGVLQWATHYGGSDNDYGYSCAVDANNNVYLAGGTWSSNNIGSGGHQNTISASVDGFLVKFNSSGVRQWGTYYGGGSIDEAYSCATDGSGHVFLSGYTESTSNISAGGHQFTLGGSYDAFLVKFDTSGVRIWSTYYGGSSSDYAYSCATDNSGGVYLAGETRSTNNISSGGHQNSWVAYRDAFLVKFNSATAVREWGTYYGGNGNDYGNSCAVDNSDNVYLAGKTNSSNNISSGGYQNSLGGGYDAYLVKFNPLGVRQWATYYGGLGDDHGASCSVDLNDDVYLDGMTESNSNIAFNGHDMFFGGTIDHFLSKFSGSVCLAPDQPTAISGSTSLCENATETYSVTNDPNATSYTWTLPSGWSGISTTNSISATAGATGGTIEVIAENSCGVSSSQTLSVTVNTLPNVVASGTATICEGDATPLNASGASTYTWSNGAGTGASVSVSPTANTTYTVTGTDGNGCENTDDVTVTVNSLPTVTVTGAASICVGESTPLTASGASTYTWSNGAGTGASVSVSPTTNTTYTVTGTDGNGCENTDDATVTVNSLPTVIANGTSPICEGESTTLTASGANSYSWDNGAGTGSSVSVAPTTNTTYTVTGTDANGCENTDAVTVTVNPLPTVTASDDQTICEGESTTISASGAIAYTWDNGLGSGSTQTVSPTSNTTYTVTGTDANGCENTDVVTISTQIVPDNGVTLEADQVTITANSTGIDYTWVDCENNFQVIPGETNQSFTAVSNGNYAVIVSNQGCADTSDCIVIDKVSLSSNTLNPSITLVPNPTSSITKIVTDTQINKVQVVDFSGKIIEVPQNAAKTELDFSNLSRGTYFINIETSNGSYVERVVVI